MTKEQIETILTAWDYFTKGDPVKDAFDSSSAAFDSLEEAFIALCEDHFGKDFISNWSDD